MNQPFSPNSQKGFKLLELRDKLARLNSPTRANPTKERLRRIYDQNKNVQTEISSLFDRISRHYFESEQTIALMTQETITTIQYRQSLLLKQLDALKQKQLDAIKDDVERYLRHSKKIKKLMSDSTANELIEDEVKKIKPFRVKEVLQKIQSFKPESQKIDIKIQRFKEQVAAFIEQIKPEYEKKLTFAQNRNNHQNILKISGIARNNSDLSSFNEDLSRFLYRKQDDEHSNQSKKREEDDEQYLMIDNLEEENQKNTIEGDRKTQKWQEKTKIGKKDAIIEIQARGKNKQVINSREEQQTNKQKLMNIIKYDYSRQTDKLQQQQRPRHKNQYDCDEHMKVKKEEYDQFKAGGKAAIAANHFLENLRNQEMAFKNNKKQVDIQGSMSLKFDGKYMRTQKNSETSTPQERNGYIFLSSKYKSHRLSRVKSQDQIISPVHPSGIYKVGVQYPLENPSDDDREEGDKFITHLKGKYEEGQQKQIKMAKKQSVIMNRELTSLKPVDLAKNKINLGSQIGKNSRERQSGTKRGNWAQILRQQQSNYNQMRRKIKN